MSMCYLCDMCAKCTPDIVGDEWCTGLSHYLVLDKLAIDYGRDGPRKICEHFEPKEGEQMSEYVVDFGDDAKSAVRMAMARQHGAELREEIVRCRDCKYYHDGTSNGRRYAEPYCLDIGELAYGALFEVDEDCFCSQGKRREVRDD